MKYALLLLIFILSIYQSSADRARRQLRGYSFPGPRREVKPVANSDYANDNYPTRYSERPPYEEDDQDQGARPAARPSSSYRPDNSDEYASHNYRPTQSYPAPTNYERPATSAGYVTRPKVESYGTPNRVSENYSKEKTKEEEEEEDQTPSKLEILLASSKFTCASKKDGYYADESVNCQVFHYCVAEVKHSWMCPENTVFHQVHLNCVPASQDICSRSEKFYIVNDYLHKLIDDKGPNNTLRYHQRYYPEEFLGEMITHPSVQSFGGPPVPSRRKRPQSQPAPYTNYPENYANSNEERPYVRRQIVKPQTFASNQDSYQSQPVPHSNYKQLYTGLTYLSSSPSANSAHESSSSFTEPPSSYPANIRAHNYKPDSSSSPVFTLYKHSSSSASNSSPNSDSNYDSNSYPQDSPAPQSSPKPSSSYPAYPPYLSAYGNSGNFRAVDLRVPSGYNKPKPSSKPADLLPNMALTLSTSELDSKALKMAHFFTLYFFKVLFVFVSNFVSLNRILTFHYHKELNYSYMMINETPWPTGMQMSNFDVKTS